MSASSSAHEGGPHIVFTCATYRPHTGGAESAIEDLATTLASHGHRVTVITRRSPPSLPARERCGGVDILRLDYPPAKVRRLRDALAVATRSLSTLRHLVTFARRERVHTICIGLVGMDSVFALVLRALLGCRLVVYLHGGELRAYVPVSSFVRRVLRRALRSSEAIVAVSAALRREATAFAPEVAAKITVIPNAIDRRPIDDAAPYSHGRRYALYAGRLHPVKRLSTLVEAFRQSAIHVADLDLLIAGQGPEEAALRRLVATYGLHERVIFLGGRSRAEIAELIKGCAYVVLPSAAEGLPVIVLEALAAGTMTIASRVKGTTEVITDGVNGVLFAEDDVEQLSALMTRYASDSAARGAIEARIRAAGLGRYDVAHTYAEHLGVYGLGNQRLKICLLSLFYFHDPGCTGLSAYYFNLLRSLSSRGHRVYLVTAADGAHDGEANVTTVAVSQRALLEPAGGNGTWGGVGRFLARLAFARAAYQRVRVLDRTVGLDVVVAPELFAQGVFVALAMGRKLMTRIHTPTYVGDRYNRRYRADWIGRALSLPEQLQVKWSRTASVASLHMRRIVCRDWGLTESAVQIIPNAVQIDWVRQLAAAQPRRIAGDYLLFVGRLERKKGVDVLLAALPEIFAHRPGITMVFAGPDHGGRERILRANGSHDARLVFLGPLEKAELFGVVRDATLVVLPSLVENLSNAGLEAMALGRPVLGTYRTSFEEIIRDSVNGFLVEPGDARALAAKVIACLASADLARVGAQAAESVRGLDADAVAERYIALYRDGMLR